MANERVPNDPYRPAMGDPAMSDAEYNRAAQMDSSLQPDTELSEGPASTGKMAAYALGIAILLGAVFYGLSNSSTSTDQAANTPATKSAATQPAPNSPAANNAPGVTTGSATNRPSQPAQAQPGGSNMDQSAPQPTGQNNDTH